MNFLKILMSGIISLIIGSLSILQTSCNTAFSKESSSEDPLEVSNLNFRSYPSGVYKEPSLRESFDTIGYVCGKFGVSDNDTLYCIALGCSYYKDPEKLDEYDAGYNVIDNYMFSSNNLFIPELYVQIPES